MATEFLPAECSIANMGKCGISATVGVICKACQPEICIPYLGCVDNPIKGVCEGICNDHWMEGK